MSIKAIETAYKGYRFRSRLEARWAVFFDALGLKWEYEPEGFELPGGVRYLPDFYIGTYVPGRVGYGPWVEVKGVQPTPSEINKMTALCEAHCSYGLLVWGQPAESNWLAVHKEGFVYDASEGDIASGNSLCDHLGCYDGPAGWGVWKRFAIDVKGAMAAAQGARFEFGESGAAR